MSEAKVEATEIESAETFAIALLYKIGYIEGKQHERARRRKAANDNKQSV